MKSRDKKLLLITTFSLFFFICLLIFGLYKLSKTNVFIRYESVLIVLCCCVILLFSYFLSQFLLSRANKINNLLRVLLKDTLHELNIPLSVIKANTQMLKTNEETPKNLKKLQRINLACDELYALYNEVDYYIKKETRYEIREAFFLNNVVEEEIEKFKIIYPKTVILSNIDNLQLFTDKRWFSKMFGNIILNSLKYNRENNDISIYTKETQLTVEDSGIGMSESEVFLIFDRYYQGRNKKNGFGIGLGIVKAFCDEYKIPIKIKSILGKGTKINIDLDNIVDKRS